MILTWPICNTQIGFFRYFFQFEFLYKWLKGFIQHSTLKKFIRIEAIFVGDVFKNKIKWVMHNTLLFCFIWIKAFNFWRTKLFLSISYCLYFVFTIGLVYKNNISVDSVEPHFLSFILYRIIYLLFEMLEIIK